MKPAAFEYHAPETVADVASLLAEYGDDAKVLAGGQSLVPLLAMRLTRFPAHHRPQSGRGAARHRAAERAPHDQGDDTSGRRRSTTTTVAAAAPLVARALPMIGHFQIRNRGTVGGSIAHADSASELPAVALALDAELEAARAGSSRRIPAADFFEGTWTTALEPEEVLTAIHFPVWEGRCGFVVDEIARRSGDFALAGVVCAVELNDAGCGESLRDRAVRHGAHAGPRGRRRGRAAMAPSRQPRTSPRSGASRSRDCAPTDDVHTSAEYRTSVGAHLVQRALAQALGDARSG